MDKKLSLSAWMRATGNTDQTIAAAVGISRVQANRIRRRVSGATKVTALRLQALTGIPWGTFIAPRVNNDSVKLRHPRRRA